MLDNLSNFPAHFAAGFLACAALFAWRRRLIAALACAAARRARARARRPVVLRRRAAPDDPARPRVKPARLERLLRQPAPRAPPRAGGAENPDVVGLVEVNARWLRKLKPLRARYPYHYEVPDEHFVGLALYSRLPLEMRACSPCRANGPRPRSPRRSRPAAATSRSSSHIRCRRSARNSSGGGMQQIAALARHVERGLGFRWYSRATSISRCGIDAYRPLAETAGLHNARAGHGIGGPGRRGRSGGCTSACRSTTSSRRPPSSSRIFACWPRSARITCPLRRNSALPLSRGLPCRQAARMMNTARNRSEHNQGASRAADVDRHLASDPEALPPGSRCLPRRRPRSRNAAR